MHIKRHKRSCQQPLGRESILRRADGADGRFHAAVRRLCQTDDPISGTARAGEQNFNSQNPERRSRAAQSASKGTRRTGPIGALSRSFFRQKLSANAQEAPTPFPSKASAEPSDPGCKRQRGPPPQRLRLPSDDWRHRRAGTRPKGRNFVRMPSPTAQNQPSVAGDPVGLPAACASHG